MDYITADTGCKIYYTCSLSNGNYTTVEDPNLNDIGNDPTTHTKLYDYGKGLEITIPNNMNKPVYITIKAIAVSSSGRKSDVGYLEYFYNVTSQQEI